jgi:penicillin-binding protein 1C
MSTGLDWRGSYRAPRRGPIAVGSTALTLLACMLIALRVAPHAPLRDAAATSRAFYASDGALLRLTLASDQQYRVWTPLEHIDPRLVDAVQLYEDRWFYWHPGVNPVSLAVSAWTTWRGTARRGGSTVTMQLARRLYRIDSRSLRGKLHQAAAALWLEARYSKHDVIEAYVNLAPYGGNIEGVGAASLIYFGKRAAHLQLPELLALAVIPQNPNRRGAAGRRNAAGEVDGAAAAELVNRPDTPIANLTPTAKLTQNTNLTLNAARAQLATRWFAAHAPDATAANLAALALPLQLRSARQLPFAAPHAVQTEINQSPAAAASAAETTLAIHLPTQAVLESAITQFISTHSGQGIRNAAALLVDTHTMQVRGWVGSADWSDASINGQVNATTAKRSPGSTLKPFIYGLALDQGVLHPRSILKDAPTAFGVYHPENFDGRFEGPITAQDALVRSRNVPAVSVSARLAQPTLYGFLKSAGVSQMASEQHYGLALTLGGGELTMEEMATLYAMLANGGQLQPLRYRVVNAVPPDPSSSADGDSSPATANPSNHLAPTARRLLSAEAAFITLDMLHANPRPDTGRRAFPRVAWKTGTSWGFRDAWTAGVFGRYVLVVWVGNFDGSSNPALVGVQVAAPLFFHIVDRLRSQGLDGGEPPHTAPPNVSRVPVCAASGDLPNEECKELATTWFIPGVSPIKVSNLHRAVWVDDLSGRAACGPGPNRHREVFEYWGSDMLQVFTQAGMPRRVPPAPARCGPSGTDWFSGAGSLTPSVAAAASDGPKIVSPLAGATYVLRLKQPTALNLRANAGRAGLLYWFADAAYLGTAQPGKDLAWQPPAAGRYTLSAVDTQGASDKREVVVEFAP